MVKKWGKRCLLTVFGSSTFEMKGKHTQREKHVLNFCSIHIKNEELKQGPSLEHVFDRTAVVL